MHGEHLQRGSANNLEGSMLRVAKIEERGPGSVTCNLLYFLALLQVAKVSILLITGMGQDCPKTLPISRYQGKRSR